MPHKPYILRHEWDLKPHPLLERREIMGYVRYEIPKDDLYQMLHVDGKTIAECAEHFGCGKRTIQKRMSEYDITFYPRRYDLPDEEIAEKYEGGKTFMELGDEYGVHWLTIRDRIKDRVDVREQKPRDGVNAGENAPRWQGGRIMRGGYIAIKIDCEYVMEHRHVMEQAIGRPLTADEVVHHMDGNPVNNALSNLMLLSNSEHGRLHGALRANPDLDQREWIMRLRAREHRTVLKAA